MQRWSVCEAWKGRQDEGGVYGHNMAASGTHSNGVFDGVRWGLTGPGLRHVLHGLIRVRVWYRPDAER